MWWCQRASIMLRAGLRNGSSVKSKDIKRRFCYGRRSVDLTQQPGFFFDTHSCVKTLQKNGFTEGEAESVTDMLATMMAALNDTHSKTLVSKTQLEIVVQETLAHIASVKKDMAILEKSEFSHLKHDTDKLALSIKQLDTKMVDEVMKLKNGLQLDLNLEKSRAKEDFIHLEKVVGDLTNRIGLEVANMHTDMANLRATFEAQKTDTIKYIAGTFLTAAGLIISVGFIALRFVKS